MTILRAGEQETVGTGVGCGAPATTTTANGERRNVGSQESGWGLRRRWQRERAPQRLAPGQGRTPSWLPGFLGALLFWGAPLALVPSARADALVATAAKSPNPVEKAPPSPSVPGPGWEKIGDTDGVTVFKREVPGSPFHGIRGSGLVQAPPWKVALVLLDDARAPEWVDSLDAAMVVNVVSPVEYIEYNHVSMPWPVSDREFLTRVTLEHDAASGVSTIRSEPEQQAGFPQRPKTVRGTLRGVYLLEPRDGGKSTYLTVELHSDPRGWLPAWLVNFFQSDWSHETIAGVRKQAMKPDLTAPPAFAEYLDRVAGRAPASH